MVLKDEMFTRVEKRKCSWIESVDVPVISLHTCDICYGSGVRYCLYTFKTKRAETIKREIENKIRSKYGYFMDGIDLSMIREAK